MTQNLHSTSPGMFTAMLGLIRTAAAARNPPVSVFAFELGQYEPGSYVTVHSIEGQHWDPETLGTFSQKEYFDICGQATIYTGDSPNTNPSVATDILAQTWALFEDLVMTPAMSNRTIPILGGPEQVYQMLPSSANYKPGPGEMVGGESGWFGLIDWRFSFEAYVTPG